MIAFVKRGTNEIVHRRIHYSEGFGGRFFDILNGAEKDACVSHHESARLEEDAHSERFQDRHDRRRIILGGDAFDVIGGVPPMRIAAFESRIVDDAHAATDTEKIDAVLAAQRLGERDELCGGLREWLRLENLRADMSLDPSQVEVRKLSRASVNIRRAIEPDAKFVPALSG